MRRKLRPLARRKAPTSNEAEKPRRLPRRIALLAAVVLVLALAPSASAAVQFLTKWGGDGSGDGQFGGSGPGAVASDSSGNVYVADYGVLISQCTGVSLLGANVARRR